MWVEDSRGKPSGDARQKLLDERAGIVKQIEALKAKPLPQGPKDQMAKFRMKDLTELASKIVQIDKKLGRV